MPAMHDPTYEDDVLLDVSAPGPADLEGKTRRHGTGACGITTTGLIAGLLSGILVVLIVIAVALVTAVLSFKTLGDKGLSPALATSLQDSVSGGINDGLQTAALATVQSQLALAKSLIVGLAPGAVDALASADYAALGQDVVDMANFCGVLSNAIGTVFKDSDDDNLSQVKANCALFASVAGRVREVGTAGTTAAPPISNLHDRAAPKKGRITATSPAPSLSGEAEDTSLFQVMVEGITSIAEGLALDFSRETWVQLQEESQGLSDRIGQVEWSGSYSGVCLSYGACQCAFGGLASEPCSVPQKACPCMWSGSPEVVSTVDQILDVIKDLAA